MRIALLFAVAVAVGLGGWARGRSTDAGRDAFAEAGAESGETDDASADPETTARADVLAAPPARVRRGEPVGAPVPDAVESSGGLDVVRSVSESEEVEPLPTIASGTERRGYEGLAPDQGLDLPPSVREFAGRLPGVDPRRTKILEGTGEALDAFERDLDECLFAGGRFVTLEVSLLDAPSGALGRFGLLPPAAGTSVPIPLATADAVARRAGPAASVTLDVPEDRCVTGFVGKGCVYVADYDIEISQAAYVAGPIYRVDKAGLEVSTQLDFGNGPFPERAFGISLDAVRHGGLATFSTFSTSLASGPVTASQPVVIEIPEGKEVASEYHGTVRLRDGEGAIVGLSNGEALVVVPQGPLAETTRARTWRPVDLGARPRVEPACPPASETFVVSFSRLDAEASGATSGVLVFERVPESGDGPRSTSEDPDGFGPPRLGAPGSVSIVPGPALERRQVDVAVRPTHALEPGSRPFEVMTECGKGKTKVDLPRVSRAAMPLRFLLRDGETGERDVTIDRGEGPETWRVTVVRRSERGP